jgi:hypothetical protein
MMSDRALDNINADGGRYRQGGEEMREPTQSDGTDRLRRCLSERVARLSDLCALAAPAPSSRVPILGGLVVLLRRLFERLALRWHLDPLRKQQQRFNEEAAAAIEELAALGTLPRETSARAGTYKLTLDYPVNPRPRYGYGRPPHPQLNALIERGRSAYVERLRSFLRHRAAFARIPLQADAAKAAAPAWQNDFFTGLDAVALYAFLADNNAARYFEIGSGSSTKFARRAIGDLALRTKITAFDPEPRAEIGAVCDLSVRQPVEDVDLRLFDALESGDILLIDNSHRVFMNSDATTVFLDLLPRLKPGVLVGFHDIFLPIDYPDEIAERYYSEQYLLAAYLLGGGQRVEIVLPCAFISNDPELSRITAPIWEDVPIRATWGLSFWLKML